MTREIGGVKDLVARIKRYVADADGRMAAAILVLGSILAVAIRLPLFRFESLDYHGFYHPWFTFIRANGGIGALGRLESNYTPLYMTCMALLTYLPLSDLLAIKLLSFAFELFAAVVAYRLVRIRYATSFAPALAYTAVLCWPTVILNGSMWGQCDMFYSSWVLAMVLALSVKRIRLALVFFGLAISFKLQALFLFPLLPLFWLRREISFRAFLVIPLVYLVSGLPVLLAGQPVREVYFTYLLQANAFHELTKNAPTIYQWVPPTAYGDLVVAGSLFALAFVVCLCAIAHRFLRHLTADVVVHLALTFAVTVPFLLPKMHDRYFFSADVLSVVYGFFFPHRFYVPLVICLLSFLSYCPYLLGATMIDLRYVAVGMAGIAVLLLYDFVERCRAGQPPLQGRQETVPHA